MRKRERSGMSSRTTCSRCWRIWRWNRPSAMTARAFAMRR
jgi:hypothetical protein